MQRKHLEDPIQLKPTFVKTRNVRNFEVLMDGLAIGEGEGRFGIVYSPAGRGKTVTSQWWHGHHDSVYLRVAKVWESSVLEFLMALCKELNISSPPRRKGACFTEIVDRLISVPIPVFIDELEKLPDSFMDVVKDISDFSTAPIILIGEKKLLGPIQRNARVWSRVFQMLEFEPILAADIILYANEFASLKVTIPAANVLHKNSDGDFRIVKRDILAGVQYANARGTREIDEEMAKIIVKQGLMGDKGAR